MMPDDKQLEEIRAKAKGRDLSVIEIGSGDEMVTLIVAKPTKAEWNKYLDEVAGEGKKASARHSAMENLILVSTQWPARDEVRRFVDDKPGAVPGILEKITALIGADDEVRAKKL